MQASHRRILNAITTVWLLWTVLSGHGIATAAGDMQPLRTPPAADGTLQNVILLIGDGMGLAQITAARLSARGAAGFLELDRMPVTGLVKTFSADDVITDSAAAGTALATGFKTGNGIISQTTDGQTLYTILEAARDHGMATGLVVTSSITHATPAVFAAHNGDRDNEAEIAVDLLHSNVNVLLGGGKAFFIPAGSRGSRRTDDLDLTTVAEKQGYQFVETRDDLFSATGPKILGLFQMDALETLYPESSYPGFLAGPLALIKEKVLGLFHMQMPASGMKEPTLPEMTARAIEILGQNDNGFFLMVEGSHIDRGGHANKAEYTIQQTLLFDEAVATSLAYAKENRHTLVVVTADHETGGMVITGTDRKTVKYQWGTENHTAIDVPIFAYGPQATQFTGVMDNTDIPKMIGRALGLNNFPAINNKSR